MKKSYRVDGMTCGGCAASVTKAIQALQPEAKVDVDIEAKTLTVDGLDDETAVQGAVTDAGFKFLGPLTAG